MDIPVNLAQNIVKTIEANIGYHINFMDKNGVIIASSDPDRIGDIHEVSVIVLRTKREFITTAEMTYKHSREGIDLPVEVDQEIIGTIGITGKVAAVKLFGPIIKSMSELLIKNYLSDNERHYLVERERLLVEHLLFSSNIQLTPDEEKRLVQLTQKPTAVVVWKSPIDVAHKFEMVDLFPYLKRMLQFEPHVISVSTDEIILIISTTVSEQRLKEIWKSSYLSDFVMGIGLPIEAHGDLIASYKMAEFIVSDLKDSSRFSYRHLKDEYLLATANPIAKKQFHTALFQNISPEDYQMIVELLDSYERCNGSIKQMAKELFVHKNTVQYRLNRITELTGYNPRNLSSFYYLKLGLKTSDY